MGKALAGKPIDAAAQLDSLRDQLEEQRRIAEEKEHQLQLYAADLRDTFVAERERAEELRASYVATVRSLTNAVEARDAYTGKHAERVAAYGLELTRRIDPKLADNPRPSSASCCTTSARSPFPTESSTRRPTWARRSRA